jgi:branched-chain amino acid transport system ATP-binding protein
VNPVLEIRAVSKRFEGLEALRDVGLHVREREIVALIGPNGAGKSTLLNVVAGAMPPTRGTIHYRGHAIAGWPAHRVARLGLVRTFQALELFPQLSVRENVMAGGVARAGVGLLTSLAGWMSAGRARLALARLADEQLAFVGLAHLADAPASVLPAGLRRLLAIARALATGADTLLLDEPGAGLNATEKTGLADVIGRVRAGGRTVLFVEHDMGLVGRLADRVVVLDHGERIADGTPAEIRRDPRVLEAYLGDASTLGGPGASPPIAPPDTRVPARAARVPGRERGAGMPAAAIAHPVSGVPGVHRRIDAAAPVGPQPPPRLAIDRLEVSYGHVRVLRGVSLTVAPGTIVALVGANGAGKSTLLRAISGVVPVRAGEIRLDGRALPRRSAEAVVRAGVFPSLTVWDNLILGRYARLVTGRNLAAGALRARAARAEIDRLAEQVFALFPVLRERRRQLAGTLSGGEGQMLAIGRALMASPHLLLLDEPSLGLAPQVIREIMMRLVRLRDDGLTILLVEQNARAALDIADRGYVLETGRVVATGSGAELLADPDVAAAYLGRAPEAALADGAEIG